MRMEPTRKRGINRADWIPIDRAIHISWLNPKNHAIGGA